MKNRKLNSVQKVKFYKEKYDLTARKLVRLKKQNRELFEQIKRDGFKMQEMNIRSIKLKEQCIGLKIKNNDLKSENSSLVKRVQELEGEVKVLEYKAKKYKDQLETSGNKPLWKKVFGW